jgi:hypothetical protein
MTVHTTRTAHIEPPQRHEAEPHAPAAVGDFLDPDRFAGQGVIDEHPTAAPFDLAVGVRARTMNGSG